jgi:hypothetical protein
VRWASIATVLLLAGCPEDQPFRHDTDAGIEPGEGIAIHGRVVDFESCPVPPGCIALEGMVVEIAGIAIATEPTGREGAFLIRDAPRGRALSLLVRGTASDGGAHAPTLSADAVPPSEDDVFEITLYALARTAGSLLAAVEDETGVDLGESGGYVGQVLTQIDPDEEGDRLCPDIDEGLCAVSDASATIAPSGYGQVEYVNALPSYLPEGPALLPTGTATTTTGMFLVLPEIPAIADLEVRPTHPDLALPVLVAPVEPGSVALGFHRAN